MNDHRDRLWPELEGRLAQTLGALESLPDRVRTSVRLEVASLNRMLMGVVIAAALLMLALTGCARNPPIPHRAEPVDAQCDSLCYQPCDVRIPPWQPADPDSPAAWDELPDQVLIPARLRLWTCEQHRQACERCLDRLRQAGVIR